VTMEFQRQTLQEIIKQYIPESHELKSLEINGASTGVDPEDLASTLEEFEFETDGENIMDLKTAEKDDGSYFMLQLPGKQPKKVAGTDALSVHISTSGSIVFLGKEDLYPIDLEEGDGDKGFEEVVREMLDPIEFDPEIHNNTVLVFTD